MSDTTQIASRDESTVTAEQSNEARRRVAAIPAVDIVEDAHAITLWADLPGVPKEKLDIHVHDGSLTIDAESVLPVPPNLRLAHAEVRAPHFLRRFTVSADFDTSKIEAALKDGVLKLTVPRRDEVKPRRIEVTVG
jgi:HSP20 family protein